MGVGFGITKFTYNETLGIIMLTFPITRMIFLVLNTNTVKTLNDCDA